MWIFNAIANAVGKNFIGTPNYLFGLLFNRVKADGGVTEAQQCTIEELTDLQNDNLLSSASLIVTPNAYKEGKLYSVVPSDGAGDMSVVRATTATRVNSAGLVELVPYNLFEYSEQFDNGVWAKQNSVITANTATAPNGTLTADLLKVNTTSGSVQKYVIDFIPINSGYYTFSIYAKANTYGYLAIVSLVGGDVKISYFNINTGAVGTTTSGTTSSIESLGDGWYRITQTSLETTSANRFFGVYFANSSLNTYTFTSDINDSFYLWGAQLVEGTQAKDYFATQTRLNIPRLDYSLGSCPNILLEPQRTNQYTKSEDFNGWAAKGGVTTTADYSISPSGILNADRLQFTGSGFLHNAITQVSATQYTVSCYAKRNDSGTQSVGFFVNGTGTIDSAWSLTNEWQRFTYTWTASNNSQTGIAGLIGADVSVFGFQREVGSYPTSYIPTTSASVTRNDDVISRGNIYTNNWITASGGTFFIELKNNVSLTRDNVNKLGIGDNTGLGTNSLYLLGGSASRIIIQKRISGTSATLYITTTDNCKIAIKWNGATADVFENGVKVVAATAFTPTDMEYLRSNFFSVPAYINAMALWPTPLTDDQLEILTGDSFYTYAEMASYYNYTLQ